MAYSARDEYMSYDVLVCQMSATLTLFGSRYSVWFGPLGGSNTFVPCAVSNPTNSEVRSVQSDAAVTSIPNPSAPAPGIKFDATSSTSVSAVACSVMLKISPFPRRIGGNSGCDHVPPNCDQPARTSYSTI